MSARTRDELIGACQKAGVPEYMYDGVVLYVLHGLQPGSFMRAVLANDLMEAIGRADHENTHAMHRWCALVYNDLPGDCHGSYEIVDAWKGLEPRVAREET